MNRIASLVQTLGVNSIPMGGFFLGGWSPSTTLALYWFENLVGSLLIALRIAVHWRLTGKRGHYQAKVTSSDGSSARRRGGFAAVARSRGFAAVAPPLPRPAPKPGDAPTFLQGFLLVSIVFTLGQAIFLGLILWRLLKLPVEWDLLENGAIGVAIFQVAALVVDLRQIRATPFAQLKALAERGLGRVVLVHLSVIGGMALLAWWGEPRAFFGIFVVLKLLADIGGVLPQIQPTNEPPRWITWAVARFGEPGEFEEYWRESHARDRKEAEEDEQVWDEAGRCWRAP